jgi:Kef-type K+ transport system membrane component KefB/mannitol/fructose-specific phosphotransferase system IIA component
MSEELISGFLLQILVVLALARVLGEALRAIGQPPITGEILAGILLGQTVLGHLAPDLFQDLFPVDGLPTLMLDTVSRLGVFFLLLIVGLEVNVEAAWKMRRQSLAVAITGVLVPLLLGMGACWLLFDQFQEPDGTSNRLVFSLFVGAAVAITAITVMAKILLDLRIVKSDLGLLLLSAMAINDLLGWVILAVVLGMVTALEVGGEQGINLQTIGMVVAATVAFATLCATYGRKLATRVLRWFDAKKLPSPVTPLSFVVCLGLLCGVVTEAIGIHPIFGFFIAGLMAGDHQGLSEHTRSVITQMVEAIFVPLFFASICLHVDFLGHFDPIMVAVITLLSVGGKFLGAWGGAYLVPMPRADRLPVGIAHIPGGPMGVLLALVARQSGIIGEQMFVAIVFASIFSSLLVGPALAWSLKRRRAFNALQFFAERDIVVDLRARRPAEAIDELVARAARVHPELDEQRVRQAVHTREETMGTGIGSEIAVPHGRLQGLARALVVLGISRGGIDWNAVDNQPAHLIFLILTPADAGDTQLAILSTIGRAFSDEPDRQRLARASTPREVWLELERCFGRM